MSKILDGKIHALNAEWAYAGFEYEHDHRVSFILRDMYIVLEKYQDYLRENSYDDKMPEFSLIKYPAFEIDGEKHKAYLLMKFKRISGDGLDG